MKKSKSVKSVKKCSFNDVVNALKKPRKKPQKPLTKEQVEKFSTLFPGLAVFEIKKKGE